LLDLIGDLDISYDLTTLRGTDQLLISSGLGLCNSLQFAQDLFERLFELILLDQRDVALTEFLTISWILTW